MAASRSLFRVGQIYSHSTQKCLSVSVRHSNTLSNALVEKHRHAKLSADREAPESKPATAPRDYKFVMPEFLPDSTWWKRDRICEKLERRDMLRRRAVIELPEFYVGSIMAVQVSDPYAPGKKNRFVGICIQRGGHGLRAHFTLRNIVDGQGVEIMYELYNPTMQKIEVLKLEKRLDEELFYLRDSSPEYSTVPFDFEPIPHPPGAPVPVNQIKVALGPRPWHERWERQDLKGIEPLDLPERFFERAREVAKPWEEHDLMRQYRQQIPPEDVEHIMGEVYEGMTHIEKKTKKKRMAMSFKK